MPLDPGARLGAFEIISPLGAGGMGEVYRASDTRLRRDVAVKILPEEVTRDRDRLTRFEREAHLLASLNHPNIGAIYGFEASGDVRFLVLELVEGEELAAKIARAPLAIAEAARIGLQIAEALEAAHEKGIIHRDLKPANIKITPDGTVKVLDFGLAKGQGPDGAPGSDDISLSPTLTMAATQAGVILGTAAYMSPEQAAGQPVDRRSDVWSFGVVTMEMLTGRKTFGGETVSHTMASVLKEEPDWSNLPADCPPRLRTLLQRCLTKSVRRRLQSIGEARVVLEEYRDSPDSFREKPVAETGAGVAPSAWARWMPWAIAALLGIALASSPWWLGGSAAVPERPRRFEMSVPEGEHLFRGYGSSAVISPDGTRIAYITEVNDSRRLYVHYLDQWTGSMIQEGPSSATGPYNPFFSPDGQWLGFVTRTELKKVPVRGGSPITLCSLDRNRGSSWGADGTIVFSRTPGGPLFRVSSSGGEPEAITTLDEQAGERSHRWPQVLPGGKAVLFTSMAGENNFDLAKIEVLDLETRQRKVVHQGGSYGRYLPSGHIVYYFQGTLFGFPFDLSRLEPAGSVTPLVENLAGGRSEGGAQFSVADDGTLIYSSGDAEATTTLVWVDRQGRATPLWDTPQDYQSPTLSPDGTLLAVALEAEGNTDIWIYDIERHVPTRLTFTEGDDTDPIWSPDGEHVYFFSDRDGKPSIYRTLADGSGEPEPIVTSDKPLFGGSVSPDGKWLAYSKDGSDVVDIHIHPLEGGEDNRFSTGQAIEFGPDFSPDGRWIVYGSNESGGFEVYVRPVSGGRGKWQISRNGGIWPRWSHDGRSILYRQVGSGSMKSVAVEASGDTFRAGQVEPVFDGPYAMGSDGIRRHDVSPVDERFVMVSSGEGDDGTHEHIQVVLDWLAEVRGTSSTDGAVP